MDRKIVVFFLWAQCIPFYAMDWQSKSLRTEQAKISPYQFYKDEILTEVTVCQLSEKMPSELQIFFDEWTNENKAMLDFVIPPSNKLEANRIDDILYRNQFLNRIKNSGFENKSLLNAALPLMVKDKIYYFKWASEIRRSANICSCPNRKLPLEYPETLQTVSHMPVYLRLKGWIEGEKKKTLTIPPTFLGQIAYRPQSGSQAHDYNTILVQEELSDFNALYLQPNSLKNISQESIDDLVTAIHIGPLHDINTNLLFNAETKQLGLNDFEKNWEEPPQSVFTPNDKQISKVVAGSIAGLYALSQEAAEDSTIPAINFLNKLNNRVWNDKDLLKKLDEQDRNHILNAQLNAVEAIDAIVE
jgi:hypothetical protein